MGKSFSQSDQSPYFEDVIYKKTLDALPQAIHLINRKSEIILINRTFKEWNRKLGLNPDYIGKKYYEVFPFLPLNVKDQYETVFATGEPLINEESVQINNDTIFTQTRKIPIIENNQVAYILTYIEDITSLIKIDEKINNLAKFPSENPSPVMRVMSDGELIYANVAASPYTTITGV